MKNFKRLTSIFSILFLLIAGVVWGQDKMITYNQLPSNAKTFLSSQFKGVKTAQIIEDREIYGVDEYKVILSNGVKVEFDRKGNWKEVDGEYQRIPTGFIPASIKSYVSQRFPNTHIQKIEKERWSYSVELSNGIDIDFDSKGNFKKIDD